MICEICREPKGRFDPKMVSTPLLGGMFKPMDDVHGYPHPLNDRARHQYMTCLRDNHPEPIHRHRPIRDESKILTNMGYFEVGGPFPGLGRASMRPRVIPSVEHDDFKAAFSPAAITLLNRSKARFTPESLGKALPAFTSRSTLGTRNNQLVPAQKEKGGDASPFSPFMESVSVAYIRSDRFLGAKVVHTMHHQ